MLEKSRAKIENAGFQAGVDHWPADEQLVDHLSLLLENTALVADLVLRLPDTMHRCYHFAKRKCTTKRLLQDH